MQFGQFKPVQRIDVNDTIGHACLLDAVADSHRVIRSRRAHVGQRTGSHGGNVQHVAFVESVRVDPAQESLSQQVSLLVVRDRLRADAKRLGGVRVGIGQREGDRQPRAARSGGDHGLTLGHVRPGRIQDADMRVNAEQRLRARSDQPRLNRALGAVPRQLARAGRDARRGIERGIADRRNDALLPPDRPHHAIADLAGGDRDRHARCARDSALGVNGEGYNRVSRAVGRGRHGRVI